MKFNSNGKFKIMQITDIQEIPKISADTLLLIDSALEQEKPDLVVLTGDQIKGYGASYKGKGDELENQVKAIIGKLLSPITKRNIPFAVAFGNHDCQVGISNREQFDRIYKSFNGCVGEPFDLGDSRVSCNIPIKASNGSEKDVFNLYLFDSGTDAKGGGYEPFDEGIIRCYKDKRDELKSKNGHYVPSIIFQHIPLPEYYNVLRQVKKNTKGAVRAYRTHKNEYYVLGDCCGSDGIFLEPPSIPDKNNGEFEAVSQCGDVLAVFVGHDHKNSFVGRYKNIDLGFTQSAGFNAYGNGKKRGVRIINLDENNPWEYDTYTRTYDELTDGKLSRPLFDFITGIAPATVDAALALVPKALAVILALAAVITIFTVLF